MRNEKCGVCGERECRSRFICAGIDAATEGFDNECEGHPAGPYDDMGKTVYCDGSCRKVVARGR